jgi:hypothetical protein
LSFCGSLAADAVVTPRSEPTNKTSPTKALIMKRFLFFVEFLGEKRRSF